MSLISRDPRTVHAELWQEAGSIEGYRCFYCGLALSDPAIEWQGRTGGIMLHPRCAVALMIRLMRDVHEVECLFEHVTEGTP